MKAHPVPVAALVARTAADPKQELGFSIAAAVLSTTIPATAVATTTSGTLPLARTGAKSPREPSLAREPPRVRMPLRACGKI